MVGISCISKKFGISIVIYQFARTVNFTSNFNTSHFTAYFVEGHCCEVRVIRNPAVQQSATIIQTQESAKRLHVQRPNDAKDAVA
jgi:hypothetical protein